MQKLNSPEKFDHFFQEISEQYSEEYYRYKEIIQICVGGGCIACGSTKLKNEFEKRLKDKKLEGKFLVKGTGCLGPCSKGPVILLKKADVFYENVQVADVEELIDSQLISGIPVERLLHHSDDEGKPVPHIKDIKLFKNQKKIVLRRCGTIDPEKIADYIASGGYVSLKKALTELTPDEIIEQMKISGLRGRGGAGFPTFMKWSFAKKEVADQKYILCNADEGDPGAFMDRTILESNPHLMLEGLALAAYAVGAQQGYIYIRAEYPLAVERVELAVQQAREAGLLGRSVLGSPFDFDVEIFKGSGAFVCGEETALIASMEGEPGMPRHRPPFPAVAGLRGKPTVINNVKTLSYVPYVIKNGADWFRSIGTPDNPGTAIFALAGKVVNTGLVEVPMSTTLNQVIFEAGSGIADGKSFKAVQIGGPSGGCLPDSILDTPIDFDSLSKAGAMMGSGGMVVLNEDDCMVEMARFFLDFTQQESCGKCTFCRLGTKHMLMILENITKGKGRPEDIELLLELAGDVKAGSLCSLGKTAPNPVLSTILYFRAEYEAHIHEKRCPALMCKDLIAYYILPEKCERSCNACVGSCPVEAIFSNEDRIKVIDQEKCVKCDSCLVACPPQYKAVVKLSPPEQVAEKEKGKK